MRRSVALQRGDSNTQPRGELMIMPAIGRWRLRERSGQQQPKDTRGIAIELAPEMVQGPDGSPEFHLLESIYKTAVKLSYGVDIAAQVKRW
jgi:hypothetical protein